MSWITKRHNQTAVYWGSPVPGEAGNTTFDLPVEIDVRWEDKSELFIDVEGQETRSQAVVYVGQDVDIGGWLYLGDEDDLDSSHDDPTIIIGARPVKMFRPIPRLINSTDFERKVFL